MTLNNGDNQNKKSLGIKDVLYYESCSSCIAAWSIFYLLSPLLWLICKILISVYDYMVHFLKTMLLAQIMQFHKVGGYKHKSLNTTLNAHFMLISSSSLTTRSWWEPILHFLAFSVTRMVLFKHTVTTAKERLKYEKLGPRAQLKQTLITTIVT